ncbi:MAG TPA: hypothetical protein VFZ31_10765 [Vicinamibacterales bacterium]
MAATQGVVDAIDRIIQYFNSRRLDLPDGFFDRRTQFLINGAAFETLLGRSPDDPLILMLARGPAGFRFTTKALQHAIPDARIEKRPIAADGDPSTIAVQLKLAGKLRGTAEQIDVVVPITLKLAAAGHVEIAEATMDESILEKIREARLRP